MATVKAQDTEDMSTVPPRIPQGENTYCDDDGGGGNGGQGNKWRGREAMTGLSHRHPVNGTPLPLPSSPLSPLPMHLSHKGGRTRMRM